MATVIPMGRVSPGSLRGLGANVNPPRLRIRLPRPMPSAFFAVLDAETGRIERWSAADGVAMVSGVDGRRLVAGRLYGIFVQDASYRQLGPTVTVTAQAGRTIDVTAPPFFYADATRVARALSGGLGYAGRGPGYSTQPGGNTSYVVPNWPTPAAYGDMAAQGRGYTLGGGIGCCGQQQRPVAMRPIAVVSSGLGRVGTIPVGYGPSFVPSTGDLPQVVFNKPIAAVASLDDAEDAGSHGFWAAREMHFTPSEALGGHNPIWIEAEARFRWVYDLAGFFRQGMASDERNALLANLRGALDEAVATGRRAITNWNPFPGASGGGRPAPVTDRHPIIIALQGHLNRLGFRDDRGNALETASGIFGPRSRQAYARARARHTGLPPLASPPAIAGLQAAVTFLATQQPTVVTGGGGNGGGNGGGGNGGNGGGEQPVPPPAPGDCWNLTPAGCWSFGPCATVGGPSDPSTPPGLRCDAAPPIPSGGGGGKWAALLAVAGSLYLAMR